MRDWLKSNKVSGTTSTCNHERIGAAIVKGIHVSYTPEEVTSFLEEHVDFKVSSIRRFAEPREGERPFHWWVVTTETREQILELRKIKWFMDTFAINWEPYVSKRCPRCYNCQKYRHLAKNCFNETRCSKCKSSHTPDKCPRPQPGPDTDLSKYYCVPCEQRGHWAGWKSCPKYIANNEDYKTKSTPAQGTKISRTGQMIRSAQDTKRDATREGTTSTRAQQSAPTAKDFEISKKKDIWKAPRPNDEQRPNPWKIRSAIESEHYGVSTGNKGSAWAKMVDETKDLFGRSPAEMMQLCNSFIASTRKMNDFEKAEAYIEFYSYVLKCGP